MKLISSFIICLLCCLAVKTYGTPKNDAYYDMLSESGYNDRCVQKTTPEQLKERNTYWDKEVSPKVYKALQFLEQAPIKPIIEVTISKQGDILDLKLLRSTTNEATDQKALEAIRALSPFAPLPPNFPLKSDSSLLAYNILLRLSMSDKEAEKALDETYHEVSKQFYEKTKARVDSFWDAPPLKKGEKNLVIVTTAF